MAMAKLADDPMEAGGIAGFAEDLRAGRTTAARATRAYLDRIEALNGRLQAFIHVAAESAMRQAEAVDAMLASGTDLGPLMGVPVGVKDICAVDGMPTTNGSLADTSDITGPEGRVVQKLRQAGSVLLGKTRTVEYALGATGLNKARGTPWNPWDAEVHRFPGGSSSGSGVGTAAGLCAWGIGTDTGGSVRIPASFNGLFGHKTTVGRWPTDGVFPLSPTLDSIGPLTRHAADAAIIHAVMTGEEIPQAANLSRLRLGRPTTFFEDDLDEPVAECFAAACAALKAAGVEIVDVEVPDPSEREWIFPAIVPAELIASLGEERFRQIEPNMDPTTAKRAAIGLKISAVEHARAQARRRVVEAIVDDAMAGFDGWITPTTPFPAMAISDLDNREGFLRGMQSSRNTQPGNLWRQTAVTLPIHQFGSALPVGLQVMCRAGADAHALSIGLAMEGLFGPSARPNLDAFL
jgi:aspartyl-tRNA(Asn)/glutamyl-tRNA(Gln) amidotransferase subunit A